MYLSTQGYLFKERVGMMKYSNSTKHILSVYNYGFVKGESGQRCLYNHTLNGTLLKGHTVNHALDEVEHVYFRKY